MTNEEILNRIEKIRSISKKEINNPPVSFVLATDGSYILSKLYDEYASLIEQKISKKLLSSSEQAKLEQLSYIKDKMLFLQKKAKASIDAIYIIPDDIADYLDALHLYNDLSIELNFILSHISSPSLPSKKTLPSPSFTNFSLKPEDDIDSSISPPIVKKPKISLDDSKEALPLKNNTHLDISSPNSTDKQETQTKNSSLIENSIVSTDTNSLTAQSENPNFKLFQDLADIDRILGNISFSDQDTHATSSLPSSTSNPHLSSLTNDLISKRHLDQINKPSSGSSNSKFSIGSIVSPSSDVPSYNNSSSLAFKDSLYRIVSFVALDSSDIVVDSSSSFGLSYRDFSSSHPSNSTLFILSKQPLHDIDINSWASRDISLDLPLCIGSFSNLSSFSIVSL